PRSQFSRPHSCTNSHAERITVVQDQGRLGRDVCPAGNAWKDLPILDRDRPLKDAADNALLPPNVARLQLVVRQQAGEFSARARSAGGAIVGLARTEHEVAAVGTLRRP